MTCKFTSGYSIREVIDLIQPLRFQTEEDRHELSVLYESRLGEMGNAGRDGGQYYTPRSLIRVMVRILDPQIGEKVYDGACGSGGFLCEAFNYMKERNKDNPKAYDILQHKTFFGGEVKALPYVTAQMNCILHGLESPNIVYGNTLAQKIADFSERDRVHVILANPPFGAGVNKSDQENFTVRTGETALLFLEHFIAKLKQGGRAAIVIKNTFLSNTDNASVALRKMLLARCELEWVLDLPQKVFAAGVHTVVLFFRKGKETKKPINYYQLDLKGVSLGKTRPLNEADLAEFEKLAKGDKVETAAHWTIDSKSVNQEPFDLSVVNPNIEEEKLPSAAECKAKIKSLYAEIGEVIKGM
jgi:type I restriction enzyme M protein